MDHNDSNNLLRAILNDVLGWEDSDSLHGNEHSYGGYADGPDRYLDTDDEDLQNLTDQEINRSHQSVQDEDLNISNSEEDLYGEDGVEEEEGPMHDNSYTNEQYTAARNQSKRVDCKARVNYHVMNDGSFIVAKVILEHNHELEPALLHFKPCHRKLSRTLKRSLTAHDITGLKPSKSIRLLEVEAGGPERMTCTPKDYRNYILQQRRLRTLSSNTAVLHRFFWHMSFASFISINHHNQSILMGCGLLTSKDIETYAFIFRTWLTPMGEIPPTAILTDQCKSIKVAICEVMPNTVHRAYVVRLPYCEIERHADFDAVEGVEMLGDGDVDTMMYTMRKKAVKVGVAAGDRVVEVVEKVGCVIVEEVEAMMQMCDDANNDLCRDLEMRYGHDYVISMETCWGGRNPGRRYWVCPLYSLELQVVSCNNDGNPNAEEQDLNVDV
ncbi:hypothetical protein FXO38_05904 [Capsicum annuum]|nr:hypothetical protein FXO38_05904 [Capsicum annuum]